MTLSRRSVLGGLAAMPLAVWAERNGLAQTAKPYTRHNVLSAEGQKMLEIYARAVTKMRDAKLTVEGHPHSWLFQWYSHWVAGDTSKAAELGRVYPKPSPERNLAQEMWNACRAHDLNAAQQQYFLPWHRMYLFFFEQIVRNVSGDASFSLPYWDSATSDPTLHGVLPEKFRQSSDALYKILFRNDRNVRARDKADVNGGEPIDRYARRALTNDALKQDRYLPHDAYAGFNNAIDGTLHGNVHVLVGNEKNMGDVPWAARDPIFWLHHCNIDRLWASWNFNGGINPTGGWLTQSFVFADGKGTRVAPTVSEFADLSRTPIPNYNYDKLEPKPAGFTPASLSVTAASKSRPVAATPKPLRLDGRVTSAQLVERAPGGKVIERFNALAKTRLYLVLRGLRATTQPSVLYEVYLNLLAEPTAPEAAFHHVGTVNFFDAVPRGAEPPAQADGGRFFSFDVTEVIRYLQQRELLNAQPTVTVRAVGEVAPAAQPVIESIALVEQ